MELAGLAHSPSAGVQVSVMPAAWLMEARNKLDNRSVLVQQGDRTVLRLRQTPYPVAFFVEGCVTAHMLGLPHVGCFGAC
jgi:hypothetical protein